MSDTDMSQKLTKSLASLHEEMSVEQMRLYQIYVTKSLEAREAEEALFSSIGEEDGGDELTSETLRHIRSVLDDHSFRLSGNECVLLACLNKDLEGEEYIDTKRINIFLHSLNRKPSNTTKIVDGLEKKNLIEIRSDGLHSHKMYRLTQVGKNNAWSMIERFTNTNERLSVVKAK